MVGKTLSHYRLVERLGSGGMGVVYRALDERLDRDVAVKVLPDGALADDEARRRFQREAQAASRVSHTNVGVIYEFGTQDHTDFLAMEFVPGESLDRRIARGPMSERTAAAIGAQVADALAALHERGVVHCDLKPGNVMLGPGDRVKLVDFGLSRVLRATRGPSTLTMDDARSLAGTLPYMAPEQFQGRPADARADVYALGVILYEMTTGRRPFEADTPAAQSYAIVHQPPPRPRALAPELSTAFEALVLRCLDHRPEARPAPAGAIAEELKGLATGRHRRAEAAAAASVAVLPLANLSADPEQEFFVDGMTEAIIGDLARIPSLRTISRTSVMRYKGARKSVPEIARELGVDAVVEGSVTRSGQRVRLMVQLVDAVADRGVWSHSYDRSLDDVLGLQCELANAIAVEVREHLAPGAAAAPATTRPPATTGGPRPPGALEPRGAVDPAAFEAYLRGRYLWNRRTVDDVERSLEFFRRAIAIDPGYAEAYAGEADALNVLADFDAMPVAAAREQVLRALDRALGLAPDLPEALTSLGFLRSFYDWDWTGAEDAYRRAIRSGPGYATARQWFAELLATLGRFEEGEAMALEALRLDPLSLIMETALADVYFFARRYDRAIAVLRRALEVDPGFGVALTDLGRVLTQAGQLDEAIALFERAAARPGRGNKAPAGLVYALAVAGRHDRARALLAELEADIRSGARIGGQFASAVVHLALGEHDKALEWLGRAVDAGDRAVVWLKVHPRLDPLRGDPRFTRLLERMRLA